jgi:hypothetical protein
MPRVSLYFSIMMLAFAAMNGNQVFGQDATHCDVVTGVLAQLQQDPLFTQPYVDMDEWRDKPVRHRYVHGGFKGTETRFSYYFPAKDRYEGRFFQYITPVPMDENVSQGATGEDDKIGFSVASGAYFIETNGGGANLVGRPGTSVDPTIAGYRANAAAAQYSRVVAMEMYGCKRPWGYAFGGSGGAYRTVAGLENTEGVWDGAAPFVMGSPMAIPNVFTVRMYALRVLQDKLPMIADAVDVGSEADPYQHLSAEEASAFSEVSKMGFPMQAWYMYDKLDLHGFAALFPGIVAADPSYFSDDFWHKPGYEGYEPPRSLQAAKIQHRARIKRLIMASDAETSGLAALLKAQASRGLADDAFKSLLGNSAADLPVAIELDSVPDKNTLGADIFVKTGKASGEKLLATKQLVGNYLLVGEDARDVLLKLNVGDEMEINNLNFLAAQTYHRHQVPEQGYPAWDQFRDAQGKPIYPQRPMILGPLFAMAAAGTVPTGKFTGKMILLENLYDTEAYPWQGDWYRGQAHMYLGNELNDNFRLWYSDHTSHNDHGAQRVPTQTVSYLGILQQALRDVSAWVERGIAPPATSGYTIVDGQVRVPADADERGGIQPVIQLLANGEKRAVASVGEPVQFSATIEVPKGTGEIVEAAWDFDGSGTFSSPAKLEQVVGDSLTVSASHSFGATGTYFVTLRAASQREGDAETPYARVSNLDRVRIIVN